MDTPLPAQIRPAQPEATHATESEEMELMEMILGALGRDALGLGSSIAHPRESEEWQGMDLQQKLDFFAPIWRIMRDENMSVEQVTSRYLVFTLSKLCCSRVMHHEWMMETRLNVSMSSAQYAETCCLRAHVLSDFMNRVQATVLKRAAGQHLCLRLFPS